MKLDEFDLKIIQSLSASQEQRTTWQIAKDIYVKSNQQYRIESIDNAKVTDLCTKVGRRLNAMHEKGMVIKHKNGDDKWSYILNLDVVKIVNHKFSDKFSKALILRIPNLS